MPKARIIEPAHGGGDKHGREKKGRQRLQSYETGEGSILTKRQIEVVQLFADGLTREEIGKKLFISKHTVAVHLKDARTRAGIVKPYEQRSIVIWAKRKGLIT